MAQDKAAIQTDQAQVQTAQLNLNYTRIVSPIDGRVGIRLVDAGNYLQPSDATGIVIVTELNPISVIFSTAEDNLPRISARLNAGADIAATAYNRANVEKLAEGTLTTYDSQVDITTGTIKMRATFDNPKGAFSAAIRQHPPADRHAERGRARPQRGGPDRPDGQLRLSPERRRTVSKRDVGAGPSDSKSTTITSGPRCGRQGCDRRGRPAAGRRQSDGRRRGRASAGPQDKSASGGKAAGSPDACAAALTPEARAIYAAAAPEFASAADPRAFVRGKVQDLVKAGTVQQSDARASAMAARACLTTLPAAGRASSAGERRAAGGNAAGGAASAPQGAAK